MSMCSETKKDLDAVINYFKVLSDIGEYIDNAKSSKTVAYSHLAGNGATASLEAKLCSLYGAKHTLCVDSATNGLMYLLMATGLQRSDILTTPLSYGGTIAGALALDCKFYFAPIDATSLNLNVNAVPGILDSNKTIKAIIATEFSGNSYDMQTLHRICEKQGIWHFVDSAQSLGYDYGINNIADYNDAIVVSFGSGKQVFAGGEGGAIITNNTELYKKLISICQHPHRQERDCGIGLSTELSLNGRMHPLAAIIANGTFEQDLEELEEKREILSNALNQLAGLSEVEIVLNQRRGTYYHCPFTITNESDFAKEFETSQLAEDYYWAKANFTPIPEQLLRIGEEQRVGYYDITELEDLLKQLYLLHPKN